MSRLVLQCNPAGRVTAVLCDDAAILGADMAGKMLGTVLAPSGVAHFYELLGHLEEHDVVCDWMLEFGARGEPAVYHCSAARDDSCVLLAGADSPGDATAGLEDLAGLGGARALVDRIAGRAADTRAIIADLRAQIAALQYQTKSPLKLENELVRMAAHDLRNPLLVVSMNCSFLLHDCEQLNDEQRDLLSDTLATSEFMTRYLDGMTSLAELWVGTLELDSGSMDLAELVRYTAEQNAVVAAKRDIAIDIAGIAPIELVADKRRLTQVFNQIFSNVIKFCPAGSTARVVLERRGGEAVCIVEDDGPGIPAKARRALFRPFGKAHVESTSPEDYGAGVGLPIARRLIEAHGGRIEIDSEEGRGTRVEVALPL